MFSAASRNASHGQPDPLPGLLRQTCFAEHADAIAGLLRSMQESYHEPDAEKEEEAIGQLSSLVFGCVPTLTQVSSVGAYPVYTLATEARTYRFQWGKRLTKGCYNRVYYGNLTAEQERRPAPVPGFSPPKSPAPRTADRPAVQPVVVKTTRDADDLRVYVLENVIHAILCVLPALADHVVPFRFAFKLPRQGDPPFTFGVVLDDPCTGHLGQWLEGEHAAFLMDAQLRDDKLFSLLTSVARMLHSIQAAHHFQHRDLKCDNVMYVAAVDPQHKATTPSTGCFAYPSFGMDCKMIDFGMTRLQVGDRYLGCDCVHDDAPFNAAGDLQFWCLTMLEDYQVELSAVAPRFYRWLEGVCDRLQQQIRAASTVDYDTLNADERSQHVAECIVNISVPTFCPAEMLRVMHVYWESKSVGDLPAQKSPEDPASPKAELS